MFFLKSGFWKAAEAFPENPEEKSEIPQKIAFPHSSGFLGQAPSPFHPHPLNPAGRARNSSGVEIEKPSHADCHGRTRVRKAAGDPFFLGGNSQGNKKDIGTGIADPGSHPVFLRQREETVLGAADHRPWMVTRDPILDSLRHAFPSPQEEDALSGPLQDPAEARKKVGSIDVVPDGASQNAPRNPHPDSIREDKIGRIQDSPVFRVFPGKVGAVGIHEGNLAGPGPVQKGNDGLKGFIHSEVLDSDPQDPDLHVPALQDPGMHLLRCRGGGAAPRCGLQAGGGA